MTRWLKFDWHAKTGRTFCKVNIRHVITRCVLHRYLCYGLSRSLRYSDDSDVQTMDLSEFDSASKIEAFVKHHLTSGGERFADYWQDEVGEEMVDSIEAKAEELITKFFPAAK